MKKETNDKVFLEQVKAKLDSAAEDIDPAVEARLRGIRREAIARTEKQQSLSSWQWGGAIAASVLVIVLSFNFIDRDTSNNSFDSLAMLEDLQMLSASDDLDMYQDLEFYNWLNEIQKTS